MHGHRDMPAALAFKPFNQAASVGHYDRLMPLTRPQKHGLSQASHAPRLLRPVQAKSVEPSSLGKEMLQNPIRTTPGFVQLLWGRQVPAILLPILIPGGESIGYQPAHSR